MDPSSHNPGSERAAHLRIRTPPGRGGDACTASLAVSFARLRPSRILPLIQGHAPPNIIDRVCGCIPLMTYLSRCSSSRWGQHYGPSSGRQRGTLPRVYAPQRTEYDEGPLCCLCPEFQRRAFTSLPRSRWVHRLGPAIASITPSEPRAF